MIKIITILTFVLISFPASARVWDFDVWFFNNGSEPIVVQTIQYNSPSFDNQISDKPLQSQAKSYQKIKIDAHDSVKVSFDDAAGGYWVRWGVTTSCESWPIGGMIDLTRDSKIVTILVPSDCPHVP